MPGQYKEATIAFRPSALQKVIIDERVKKVERLERILLPEVV